MPPGAGPAAANRLINPENEEARNPLQASSRRHGLPASQMTAKFTYRLPFGEAGQGHRVCRRGGRQRVPIPQAGWRGTAPGRAGGGRGILERPRSCCRCIRSSASRVCAPVSAGACICSIQSPARLRGEPHLTWVHARVRPQTEVFSWLKRDRVCLVIDYEGATAVRSCAVPGSIHRTTGC